MRPRLPGDPEDQRGDREADERIGDLDAHGDHDGRGDDTERHEAVDTRVMAVGDQRRTVEPGAGAEPDPRRELVAGEADDSGGGEREQILEVLRMDEPAHGFEGRDAGRHEDREHHCVSGPPFAALAPRQEHDREGNRGERVAAVVDQVGEQRNRTGQQEHDGLEDRGDAEDREADGDRTYAGTRSDDRTVDGTVGVRVPVIVILS